MFYVAEKFEEDLGKMKEYKTEKNAEKEAAKSGLCVFAESGEKVWPPELTDDVPAGALEDGPNGEVKTYDEDGNQVGTISKEEAEEETEQPEEEPEPEEPGKMQIEEIEGRIRRIYKGHLRLRREPSMADDAICGVTNFEVKRVMRKAADGKDIFFQTHEGYWVTGNPELVEYMGE